VNACYHLLLQQETYSNICHYASQKWGVTSRQTARYLERARHLIAQEAAIARRNEFDYQLAIRRHLYSQAYRDRNWRLCLDVLKDEAQLLGCYPTKVNELEAIRQLTEAGVLPLEVLERISTAFGQFQQSAIAAISQKNR
jgi:hypothetical protein